MYNFHRGSYRSVIQRDGSVRLVPCTSYVKIFLLSVLATISVGVGGLYSSQLGSLILPAPLVRNAQFKESVKSWMLSSTKVDPRRVDTIVDAVEKYSAYHEVDPLLVLAVIKVESNYDPLALSHAGAMGLMQVIPKYHREKIANIAGPFNLYDLESNIQVGTQILREYSSWHTSLDKTLRQYNGSLNDPTNTYPKQIYAEMDKIKRYLRERL